MSWTVACFCGTVFAAPADHCPTCHAPVPAVTRGIPTTPSGEELERLVDLLAVQEARQQRR
jgi:hypothetical protein